VQILVIGTGYVGLVVGACLAETGNDVVCADIDARKIDLLKQNVLPIYEPGLEELVRRNQSQGRLRFTTDVAQAAADALVVFLAVGTPPARTARRPAPRARRRRDRRRARAARGGGDHQVDRAVGTAAKVRDVIAAHSHYPVHVCSNPEFLKEGAAVEDFLRPTAWCSAWTATTRARCSPSCTRRSCAPASRSCSWTWRRRS
jgi:UDPglucose 6-dehydrogenase